MKKFMLHSGRAVAAGIRRVIGASYDLRPRFTTEHGGKVRIGRDVDGLNHASFEGGNAVGRGTSFVGDVRVGYATTIGANCYVHGPASLGRYCQLGPCVGIYGRDHGASVLTTYVNSRLFNGALRAYGTEKLVVVGNDVWLGHGALLVKGVSVGNGAIVGGGAVVTRDVPPYRIVAGNPARVIRERFAPGIVEQLEQLSWWNLGPEELGSIEYLFHIDFALEPDRAIAALRQALGTIGARANHRSAIADSPVAFERRQEVARGES